MTLREVDRIAGNPNAIEAYRAGINSLFQAGVIDALRALGRPLRRKEGADHIQMASEASWSVGWNDCLDTLLYFAERHLNTEEEKPNVRMDFGSIDKAVLSGDLTKEEADAIRRGKSINYDPKTYTRNIPEPGK